MTDQLPPEVQNEQKKLERPKLTVSPEIGEAGGIAWCEVWGKKKIDGVSYPVKINLTSRSATPLDAIENLMKTLPYIEQEYKLHPYNNTVPGSGSTNYGTPVSAPPASSTPPAPSTGTGTPPLPAAGAPTSQPPAQAPTSTNEPPNPAHICRLKWTPDANGKVKVEFFTDAQGFAKYPICTTNFDAQGTADFLKPTGAWMPQHFQVVNECPVNMWLNWVYSEKTTSGGKHYKNVSTVTPG